MDVESFIRDLETNQSSFLSLVREFQYPIQVYMPDGTLAIANPAFFREFNVPLAGRIEGSYNILRDRTPFEHTELERLRSAFAGHPAEVTDIPVSVHAFKRFFHIPNEETELYFLDIKAIPIRDASGELLCVVIVCATRRKNIGREDIALSKDYIELHWAEDFDLAKVAKAASMSQYYFSRLFKKYTGMTPHRYYTGVKVEKLKQALLNENLTVEQAFASCGIQYHGHYARVFKNLTGYSPTEYRRIAAGKLEQYPV